MDLDRLPSLWWEPSTPTEELREAYVEILARIPQAD
jgi:hypothetical protein